MRISGYAGIWVYWYMGIWVYGYMGIWVYGYMGIWVNERRGYYDGKNLSYDEICRCVESGVRYTSDYCRAVCRNFHDPKWSKAIEKEIRAAILG